VDDSDKPLLPHVHCADLALFLGEGTSAWAAFSRVHLKTVPVDKVNVDAVKEKLQTSSPRPAVFSVCPDRNEAAAFQMRAFSLHVVGNLPQLVHVDAETSSRLESIEADIVLAVPRLDKTLVARATTVTHALAAAASQRKSSQRICRGCRWGALGPRAPRTRIVGPACPHGPDAS
jgi:hypothetical protein